VTKAGVLSLGVLLAAAVAAAAVVGPDLAPGTPPPAEPPPDASPAAGTASADGTAAPADAPRLASPAVGPDERRKRLYDRFLASWAEVERHWREGRPREALAALRAFRERDAEFLVEPGKAEAVARIEMAVRALDRAAALEASLAAATLPEDRRAVLDRRLAASAEVLARAGSDADLDQLTRHLKRFLLDEPGLSKDPADRVLRAFVQDRRKRRGKDANPAVADEGEAEKRRVDQLEKLRQRDAVGLLDTIHAGLAWLALHQRDDGAHSDQATLDRCTALGHKPSCLGEARGTGDGFAVAATALAAIAFLDFRDQDANGWFDPYLGRALDWLMKQQKADGSFGGSHRMYAGAMAVMALAQAAVSTGDERFREAARKGLAWYESAIGPLGGWRYAPNDRLGDLSVTAWVAQAYEAGRAAGIPFPPRVAKGMPIFLSYVGLGDHRFRYQRTSGESPSLFPAGMLVSQIALDEKDPVVVEGWKTYLQGLDPKRAPDLYTLYYGVRVSILLTGALDGPWRKWAFDLAARQVQGTAAGSFPSNVWRWTSGPTVSTAMCVLTLEHALYLR
jgi:hypothetical protein